MTAPFFCAAFFGGYERAEVGEVEEVGQVEEEGEGRL